jgi:hypothetical protein
MIPSLAAGHILRRPGDGLATAFPQGHELKELVGMERILIAIVSVPGTVVSS